GAEEQVAQAPLQADGSFSLEYPGRRSDATMLVVAAFDERGDEITRSDPKIQKTRELEIAVGARDPRSRFERLRSALPKSVAPEQLESRAVALLAQRTGLDIDDVVLFSSAS